MNKGKSDVNIIHSKIHKDDLLAYAKEIIS